MTLDEAIQLLNQVRNNGIIFTEDVTKAVGLLIDTVKENQTEISNLTDLLTDITNEYEKVNHNFVKSKTFLRLATEDINSFDGCCGNLGCSFCENEKMFPCCAFRWKHTDEVIELLGETDN